MNNAQARFGRWVRGILALMAGMAMALGQAPVSQPWTLFIAMPGLVWLIGTAPRGRGAAWVGWAAGFGYFVVSLHWVGNAFLVEPERFFWLMPLGVIGLPAGLAIFWGLAGWGAWHLGGRCPLGWGVAVASYLSLAEIARSFVLTGFPWALPAYIWSETPVFQAVAWIGPFGLTWLSLVLAGLGVTIFTRHGWGRFIGPGMGVLGVAVLWLAGSARVPEHTQSAPNAPMIRVVQPNAPQSLKWKAGYRERYYQETLALTSAPPADGVRAPDVIVWPETAVYFLLDENPEAARDIATAAGGASVILGGLRREANPTDVPADDGQNARWYNSLFTVLPSGQLGPRYDKHHLVPFGEYLPMSNLLGALGLRQFALQGGFTPGVGPQRMVLAHLPAFSSVICYEAIFPNEVVASGDARPDWIVQLTNDAWFGSFAGPQQHLVQARSRAIEQGLPVIRAANTGISAIINSYGNIVDEIALDRKGSINKLLPAKAPQTLFSQISGVPMLFIIVLVVLLHFIGRQLYFLRLTPNKNLTKSIALCRKFSHLMP